MVLQVDIEEILFAESRTIALVDFKAKEISYTCRIHFRPSRSSVFLFLYFELWGQHMAVGPSYTVYTTNVMRITYHHVVADLSTSLAPVQLFFCASSKNYVP